MANELIYAVKDNSVWQSVTKEQYADQTNWTRYTVKEFNLGLTRLQAVGNGDNDPATTNKEIYIYPKVDTSSQSRFKVGEKIYIVSPEYENGIEISLGAKSVVKGVFRHQPSRQNQNLIFGHSLSKKVKTDINDFNNVVYKNEILWNGVDTALDTSDSPYTDGDGNPVGACVISGKNVVKTNIDPFWTNGNYKKANRYFSVFYKRPKDVAFNKDSDGKEREIIFLSGRTGKENNDKNAYADSFYLSETPTGALRFRLFSNEFVKGYIDKDGKCRDDNNDVRFSSNTDLDTFDIKSDDNVLNDGKWHHIVLNIQDDNTFIAYVDNEKVFDGYNEYINTTKVSKNSDRYFWRVFPGTKVKCTFQKRIAGIIDDAQIAPDGVKMAQFELYNDVYNPNKDYVYFIKDSDHLDSMIKYDISNNGLNDAPTVVYRKNNAKFFDAMVNVGENIEEQWKEGKVVAYSINIDPDQNYEKTIQPIDKITYSYDTVYKDGRSFTQKVECDLGDVIMPSIITQLEV